MARVKRSDVLMQFFSPETSRVYRLFKTSGWPALEIAGIRMHLVQGTDPEKSTADMVGMLGQAKGTVLDCCAGLGYTAIALARKSSVTGVVTFEVDENVLLVARRNPQSAGLFSNKKIKLLREDVCNGLSTFPENFFDAILHDPPSIKIAGELYSRKFYCELFRVLKPGCKLFHYSGAPGSKRGIDVRKGISERLAAAGFVGIAATEKIKGVVGVKPAGCRRRLPAKRENKAGKSPNTTVFNPCAALYLY